MPEARFSPDQQHPPAQYMRVIVSFRNVTPQTHVFVTHDEATIFSQRLALEGAVLEEWMYFIRCVVSADGLLEGEMDVRYSQTGASPCFAYLGEAHLGELGLLPHDFYKEHTS